MVKRQKDKSKGRKLKRAILGTGVVSAAVYAASKAHASRRGKKLADQTSHGDDKETRRLASER